MSEASVQERILRHPLAAHLDRPHGEQPIHAVGGIVRDALLGHDSTDLDLSVAGHGEQLAHRIARASGGTPIVLGGDRFSSYRVVAGAFQADIWDRGGGSLRSDLERRDLTINAIACALDAPRGGSCLEDPFGGVEDLAARTLRATKEDCFERDPLRVLRLVRFRLWLEGFGFDPATASAARAASGGLEGIASERIREEMKRILESPSAARAFETLRQLDVLCVLVPATAPDSVARALLDRARHLDRILAALESAKPTSGDEVSGRDGWAGWNGADRCKAALALLAQAAGGGDPVAGVAALEARGLATRGVLASARRLCGQASPATEPERRLFLDRHRHDWRLALAVTAAERSGVVRGHDVVEAASELGKTAHSAPDLVEGMSPLLDGHQAARILKMAPGPDLGAVLRALGRAQALGEVGSPAEAEEFLRKRGSKSASTREIEIEIGPTSTKPVDAD